jgi:nitrate/nitrite transporter NarK
MLRLDLFRVRAFAAGNLAVLLYSIARGGLQFTLILWLQGVWLPLHGYRFEDAPLWAGVLLIPLTVGFLVAGPVSGWLSDRVGARELATAGLIVYAVSFAGLMLLPVDFTYWHFALFVTLNGIGQGMFSAPNTAALMGSVAPHERGIASGVRSTLANAGTALSVGISFSLLIAGLARHLPAALQTGLTANGVPAAAAAQAAGLPPASSVFAAFLGANPVQHLLAGSNALATMPAPAARAVTEPHFFAGIVADPFHDGLVLVFAAACVLSIVAAIASLARDRRAPSAPTKGTHAHVHRCPTG